MESAIHRIDEWRFRNTMPDRVSWSALTKAMIYSRALNKRDQQPPDEKTAHLLVDRQTARDNSARTKRTFTGSIPSIPAGKITPGSAQCLFFRVSWVF
ncbi:MAG TPA: hypothetical protein PKV86_13665, partial [Syntrophobacteraceae bacterium]|nr:hypothetical protein [Syntrophobacteraceae bacterium]